jgi:hypothetical protein
MQLKVLLRLQEFIQNLSKLRHLNTINIRLEMGWHAQLHDTQIEEWLGWAKKVLSPGAQNSDHNQEPKKIVFYIDGLPETHFVGPQ